MELIGRTGCHGPKRGLADQSGRAGDPRPPASTVRPRVWPDRSRQCVVMVSISDLLRDYLGRIAAVPCCARQRRQQELAELDLAGRIAPSELARQHRDRPLRWSRSNGRRPDRSDLHRSARRSSFGHHGVRRGDSRSCSGGRLEGPRQSWNSHACPGCTQVGGDAERALPAPKLSTPGAHVWSVPRRCHAGTRRTTASAPGAVGLGGNADGCREFVTVGVTTATNESVDSGIPDVPDLEAGPQGGFRTRVLRGLAWQAATRGTFEVSKIVVAVALARLLTPREYGIAGMVLVVIALEQVLGGSAFASVLIQRSEITEKDKSTVFWTTAGLGLLVCLVMVSVSWSVASFYGDQEVQPLFAVLSFDFLLTSLSQVQQALLVREMDFKSLELRSMAGVVIGSAAAIGVAAAGGGPWALVVQQLTFSAVGLVLIWRFSPWRPKLMFSGESMRSMRGFGARTSGTLVMFQLTQNTDNVLIGRFLGPLQLGFYSLAYNIILVPVSRISAPLILVLYPVFSRVQDDLKRLASIWLRVLRLTSAVAVPATLGLIVVAPDMVDVVFGRRWHAATPVIQILATVGLLYGIQGLNGAVLQACDNTKLLFRYSCGSFAAVLISFVVGLHWGIVGVASCFACVSLFIQPFYMHITARSIGIGLRDCGRALSGVVSAALASTAVALLTRQVMLAEGLPATARLAGAICAAAAIYVPLCAWRAPEVTWELRQLRRRRAVSPVANRGAEHDAVSSERVGAAAQ